MMTRYPHLFQPIRIGKTVLKNRITNAPIYNFLASWDNHVTREGSSSRNRSARGARPR